MLWLVIILGVPLLPPAEYDYQPEIPVKELVFQDVKNVDRWCRENGARKNGLIRGCSITENDKCTIAYPARYKINPAHIRRHELAHCNGWTH